MKAIRIIKESLEWLRCPNCGSNNTEIIRSAKEVEPFKDYVAIEDDIKDTDFAKGTKEQDISKYKCNDCGHEFTKTDVDIKYSKTKYNEELDISDLISGMSINE